MSYSGQTTSERYQGMQRSSNQQSSFQSSSRVTGGVSGYTVQQSGSYSASTSQRGPSSGYQIEGRDAQIKGDSQGVLRWASELNNDTIIQGNSDFSKLSNLKDALFELKQNYFLPNTGLTVQPPGNDKD